ncbi:MAG TPA: ABC transporter substrate-binding protein, partial [Chloroflexota bacterium]|nr:ABC transporter substrate-binding protein [Chloroflexota bacterium]
ACTAAPAAVPTATPEPLASVKITTAPGSPNDQPVWVAVESGLMRNSGLNLEFVSAPANQGIASLVSGNTEIASTGGAEALGGLAGGADLVIVVNLVPVIPWQFYAGPAVQSPADLRGKKIGITTAGASYDTALRLVLPKFGLNPDTDVTLITTGSIPNVSAALFSGAIDGAPLVVTPASFKVVEQGGFHEVFDFAKEAGAYPGAVTVVRRDFLTQHRDVVQKYVDAVVQGIVRFKTDRPYAIQVAKKFLDEPDETLVTRTYDYFANSVTPSQPYPKPEQFTEVLASLAERNEKARGIDLNRALDQSFVQSAIQRGLDQKK